MRQWPDILPRMGEVIRPHQFWATHYAAFQIAHKRAKDRDEAVLRPEAVQAAYEELKVLLRQERASRQYGLVSERYLKSLKQDAQICAFSKHRQHQGVKQDASNDAS